MTRNLRQSILVILFINFGFLSCINKEEIRKKVPDQKKNAGEFVHIMEKHLNAITNRDLTTLESTMSPEGEMQLILPDNEIINSVDGFMDFHREWFKDTSWTFETKILNTKIGKRMGMAVTEIMYREPEREGKPYFNRMIVSYDLEKIDGKWYVIKDHASSVETSTNQQ